MEALGLPEPTLQTLNIEEILAEFKYDTTQLPTPPATLVPSPPLTLEDLVIRLEDTATRATRGHLVTKHYRHVECSANEPTAPLLNS